MATEAARYDYYEQVGRHQRYNFLLHTFEGFMGWFGFSCFGPGLVLSVYVGLLTESRFLVVLPGIIQMSAWGLPQLLMTYFIQRFKTRKWITVVGAGLDRASYTLVWLSVALLPYIGPKWSLVMFFGALSLSVPLLGFTHAAWQDLLGRIILPGYRGRFFGITHSVGTIAAVLAANMVGRMLPAKEAAVGMDDLAYAAQYSYPLLIGVVVLWCTLPVLAITRETPYPTTRPPSKLKAFWRRAYARFRSDGPLRQYVCARIISAGSGLFGLSLFADYARRDFGISPGVIAAALGTALYIPQIVLAPLAGWLGDRIGFRRLIVISAVLWAAALAVGMTLPMWGEWITTGFVAVIAIFGTVWSFGAVGHMNMIYEYGSVEDRPVVMAIAAGVPSLFFAAGMAAGGLNVDIFGAKPVLVASLVFAVVTVFVYAFLVEDPPGEHDDADTD